MANKRFGWHSGAINCAGLTAGTDNTPIKIATSPIQTLYTTSGSTHASNSVEPFYMKSIMAGVAGVGGRARFHMYTNVALGGWSNALKGYVEYGATGKTTGLGSAVSAEILLSAGTTSGTYAPLESELVANSSVSTGTKTSFLYANIAGTNGGGKTTINTNAYLFQLGTGVVTTGNGLFEASTISSGSSTAFDGTLKIIIGSTDYFIPLSTDRNFT